MAFWELIDHKLSKQVSSVAQRVAGWAVALPVAVSLLNASAFAQKAIGPEQPIGHTLKAVDLTKTNTNVQDAATNVQLKADNGPGNLPPLINGKYGFDEPDRLVGVPKAFVSLGNGLPGYGIVVEKLHHRLTVFKLTENKQYEPVKTFRAITGKDPGDKVSRGDLRTPEGIYFVTGRLNDAELPSKYGRMAFTLDYPNIFDQRQRKSGYGIWIHATDDPSRLQKPFDTEGCVVVSNEDIVELEKYITSFEVPVVITKEMSTVDHSELETPRKKAMEMVDGWRGSWEASDFDSYMGYYSKNFRSLGKDRSGWQNYKQNLSKVRSGNIKVTISEPKILAFEGQLLVVFLQDYSSPSHKDFGRKFLYLQWEGDRYRIIAEKWYPEKKTETVLRTIRQAGSQM